VIGQAQAAITGNLTLHGVTRPVTLDATFNGGAYDRLRGADVVGFSATTTLNRSAFGVDKFSGLVTDEVTLEIEAEFLKQ
jgi:polyisoprenoid-binding protein YceI